MINSLGITGIDIEVVRQELQVDSIEYLSEAGMVAAISSDDDHCTACFNGNYPEPIPQYIQIQT